MHMKKALSVLKPKVRTKYLRNLLTERVKYIEVPENVCAADLKSDIKNGAVHMKDLEELIAKKNASQYILITAELEEQGFMAICYLAACYNSRENDIVDCCGEEDNSESPNMSERYFDAQGSFEQQDECWKESDRRIPIINISEIIDDIESFGSSSFLSMNRYCVDLQDRNLNDYRHFWQDCTSCSVCIVMDIWDIAGNQLFDALDFFGNNKRVYILWTDERATLMKNLGWDWQLHGMENEPEPEGDIPLLTHAERSRSQVVLRFSADEVRVSLDRDTQKGYYKKVLRSYMIRDGMKTDRRFSYDKIINMLLAMHSDKPNDLIEKIYKYALKDRELSPGYQFKNEDFAFIDRFVRTADTKKLRENRSAKDRLLNDLVGMDEVKRQVIDVVNMLKFNRLRESKGIRGSQYHNVHVMLGASGTAKTTVARLMGQIMAEEKLLANDRFICVNGAELKGMYVGHSIPKTKALFENHDIIVIDEAYSLIDSSGKADCFSNEVLAQLMIELENHANDKLIIFAGYGGRDVSEADNRMKPFLDSNPGIKSRINSTFYFKSYSADEMLRIFKKIAETEHYVVQPGMEEDLTKYFESRRLDSRFGNGREARSLLEGSLMAMTRRLFEAKGEKKLTVSDMQLIQAADIKLAIKMAAAANEVRKGGIGKPIGF